MQIYPELIKSWMVKCTYYTYLHSIDKIKSWNVPIVNIIICSKETSKEEEFLKRKYPGVRCPDK